jgi:hypothetical protein
VADPVKSLLLSFLRLALVWTMVSDLARFIILLFALVVASEARRRMRSASLPVSPTRKKRVPGKPAVHHRTRRQQDMGRTW